MKRTDINPKIIIYLFSFFIPFGPAYSQDGNLNQDMIRQIYSQAHFADMKNLALVNKSFCKGFHDAKVDLGFMDIWSINHGFEPIYGTLFIIKKVMDSYGLLTKETSFEESLNKNREVINKQVLLGAVIRGDIPLVKKILKKPFPLEFWNEDLEIPEPYFGTPLMVAAETGNFEMVKLLVEKGAKVDAIVSRWIPGRRRIFEVSSPLSLAIKAKNYQVISYLLEKGAPTNFDVLDSFYNYLENKSLLDWAREENDPEIIKILEEYAHPKPVPQ